MPVPQTLEDFLAQSAKLQYLNVILDKILADHKVLIFSQFKGMLDLIGDFLAMKSIKSLRIDGGTATGARQALIDKFDEPEFKPEFNPQGVVEESSFAVSFP